MTPRWLHDELRALERNGTRRSLRVARRIDATRYNVEGRTLVGFSSNDYLGISMDPRLAEAAAQAARVWGMGCGASRLITGSLGIHEQLERALAEWKGAASALLFSTGYQANLGVLQALASDGVVFSDALNHASIVDGCRLARARVVVYRHKDVEHLEALLKEHRSTTRRVVVTDGVFSMDGDVAPMAEIAALAREHDALVVVDDAHATGVLGRGTAQYCGVDPRALVQVGTLGKALGVFGGFVACDAPIRELLINRARTMVFTTAPPAAVVGAALEALRIVEREPERRHKLEANANRLRAGLRSKGLDVSDAPTPIVPVVLGDNERALRWSRSLWERGMWVHPIRPPTVPPGTARLRVSVSSEHDPSQVDALIEAIGACVATEPKEE